MITHAKNLMVSREDIEALKDMINYRPGFVQRGNLIIKMDYLREYTLIIDTLELKLDKMEIVERIITDGGKPIWTLYLYNGNCTIGCIILEGERMNINDWAKSKLEKYPVSMLNKVEYRSLECFDWEVGLTEASRELSEVLKHDVSIEPKKRVKLENLYRRMERENGRYMNRPSEIPCWEQCREKAILTMAIRVLKILQEGDEEGNNVQI